VDWFKDTRKHIDRVGTILTLFQMTMANRGRLHDQSKLRYPEDAVFAAFTDKLAGATYGSEEYKGFLRDMKPALDHHYANNRHHPEHFGEMGIGGMNLVDLLEMFADWKAASERHDDGDIRKSIEINAARFGIEPQLAAVLMNTVDLLEELLDEAGGGA